MTIHPPTSEYRLAREAELQLELTSDKIVARMADVRRARMDVRDAGKLDRAESFDSEFQALHAELDALRRRG